MKRRDFVTGTAAALAAAGAGCIVVASIEQSKNPCLDVVIPRRAVRYSGMTVRNIIYFMPHHDEPPTATIFLEDDVGHIAHYTTNDQSIITEHEEHLRLGSSLTIEVTHDAHYTDGSEEDFFNGDDDY